MRKYARITLLLFFALMSVSGLMPLHAQNDECGAEAAFISAVQGSAAESPLNGQQDVVVEGIVIGDFQDKATQLNRFAVQEESADFDDDPATSEGLWVVDNNFGVDVNVGDVVRVRGTVAEVPSEDTVVTELVRLQAVIVCGAGEMPAPVEVTLPHDDLERYEGMLVTLPQTLTVSDNFDLARFGEVLLSVDGRLFQPTNIAAPGSDAGAVQDENNRRTIVLDDASLVQNPDPVAHPAGGLSANNTLRNGDTITGLTGVLDQRFSVYRVQPTGAVAFEAANPRSDTPPDVDGSLRIASMNVLNYFNGDGEGGGFPTSRGATNPAEFDRQRDKIINAIVALDADIVALMEIENDGYGADSAIQDLLNGINTIMGDGTYAFIDPGFELGTDQIRVALIYNTSIVTPIGASATTDTPPFDKIRLPLAQTFEQIATGERLTVVANHFKSKGSCPANASDPNADLGDGQSCWNAERLQTAQVLTEWLATDPTSSGDPDFLILGDLNAYAMEDPITAIKDAGYVDLIAAFAEDGYSYVFFGQAGYLDHALASESLAEQVAGAAAWHINADEPRALDYNEEFKSPGQVDSFYTTDPFRSSDHDPLIVGFILGEGMISTATPELSENDKLATQIILGATVTMSAQETLTAVFNQLPESAKTGTAVMAATMEQFVLTQTAEAELDENVIQTATAIVAGATETAAVLTVTAEAPEDTSPELTATAIVAGATTTAEAIETDQAEADEAVFQTATAIVAGATATVEAVLTSTGEVLENTDPELTATSIVAGATETAAGYYTTISSCVAETATTIPLTNELTENDILATQIILCATIAAQTATAEAPEDIPTPTSTPDTSAQSVEGESDILTIIIGALVAILAVFGFAGAQGLRRR